MGHGSNLPGSTPVPSRLAATYPMHLTEPQTVKAFVTPKGPDWTPCLDNRSKAQTGPPGYVEAGYWLAS